MESMVPIKPLPSTMMLRGEEGPAPCHCRLERLQDAWGLRAASAHTSPLSHACWCRVKEVCDADAGETPKRSLRMACEHPREGPELAAMLNRLAGIKSDRHVQLPAPLPEAGAKSHLQV